MPDRASPRLETVTIVTHNGLPQGAPDDQLLADAFSRLGVSSRFSSWDDPGVCWSATPLTIVRSAWTYHRSPDQWINWIERVARETRLINSAAILQWNTDKRYLRSLAAAGIDCVPTHFVEPGETTSLRSIMHERGWADVIVKPAIGASAAGARRFNADLSDGTGEDHLAALLDGSAALVQPYQTAVESKRERSLVFIGGAFAHAFTKPAFNTDAAGRTALLLHEPTAAELTLADAALAASPDRPVYARVDMVPSLRGPLLMELELIEPDLGLRLDRTGPRKLAQACLN